MFDRVRAMSGEVPVQWFSALPLGEWWWDLVYTQKMFVAMPFSAIFAFLLVIVPEVYAMELTEKANGLYGKPKPKAAPKAKVAVAEGKEPKEDSATNNRRTPSREAKKTK
jgi:hypothetical protein